MKPTKNYWPLGVTLTLVFFFLGTVGLIVMASTQRVDLVTNNYYEDEIRFQKQIDRVALTQHLETKASAVYDIAARRLNLSLPLEQVAGGFKGQVQLYRPSNSDLDQTIDLKPDASGQQSIDASNLQEGLWRVKVSWNAGGEDYYFDKDFVVQPAKS